MIVDVQTILLWAILFAGLIYETTMWIYRKLSAGEQFSLEKYAMTYGYVALLAVGTYFATGIIPGVSDVMINLNNIPTFTELLPVIMAVIFGIFQQGSRKIAASNKPPEAIPASGTSSKGGLVTVSGIYGGSALGATPQKALAYDINQIPNLFFELLGVATGQIALEMLIDGVIQKKWMPDITSDTGEFTAKVTNVGEKMAFGFNLWNAEVPGSHIITIKTGQYDYNGTNPTWLTTDNFVITLTGKKPLE